MVDSKINTMCLDIIDKLSKKDKEEILFEKEINLPIIRFSLLSNLKKFGWVFDVGYGIGFILFYKKYLIQIFDSDIDM